MNQPSHRRRSRELVLQVLFQKEFVQEVAFSKSLEYFRTQLDVPKESLQFAETLLDGIEKHKNDIDAKISEKSRNWKINRMSPVDLNILRIGVFELCFQAHETPPKVVIDEAIEIAKRYSGTDSPSFINGILDEIHKTSQEM